ncbi:unnamed protein product, partial [Vitis vinifera]
MTLSISLLSFFFEQLRFHHNSVSFPPPTILRPRLPFFAFDPTKPLTLTLSHLFSGTPLKEC